MSSLTRQRPDHNKLRQCPQCTNQVKQKHLSDHIDSNHQFPHRFACTWPTSSDSTCPTSMVRRNGLRGHVQSEHLGIPFVVARSALSKEQKAQIDSYIVETKSIADIFKAAYAAGRTVPNIEENPYKREKDFAVDYRVFTSITGGKFNFDLAEKLDKRFNDFYKNSNLYPNDGLVSELYCLIDPRKIQVLVTKHRNALRRGERPADLAKDFSLFVPAIPYWGKGIPGRLYLHDSTSSKDNKYTAEFIKDVEESGQRHLTFSPSTGISNAEACAREAFLIETFDRRNLTNIQAGKCSDWSTLQEQFPPEDRACLSVYWTWIMYVEFLMNGTSFRPLKTVAAGPSSFTSKSPDTTRQPAVKKKEAITVGSSSFTSKSPDTTRQPAVKKKMAITSYFKQRPSCQEVKTEVVAKEELPVKKSVVDKAKQAVNETGDVQAGEKVVEKVVEKAEAESATVDEEEPKEENGKAATTVDDDEEESQDSQNGDEAAVTNGSTKVPEALDEESNEVEEDEVESSKRKSITEEEPEISPKKKKTDFEAQPAEESVTTFV